MIDFKDTLSKILQVSKPWKIENIEVHHPTKTVNVFIDYEKGTLFPCSKCKKASKVYDSTYRTWRHLDICDYRCYLNIKIPRTVCQNDGVKVIEKLPFARMNTHYSFQFEQLIMKSIKNVAVSTLAGEIGEPDNNLWRVFQHYIQKALDSIDCSKTIRIGIDEKSYKKGHKYVTIFTDLDKASVIFVCEGKDESTLARFYEKLFDMIGDPNNIKLICMDMSKSFISGQKEYFSWAEVVFDKFHIKKSLNEAVNKVRKQEVATNETLKNTKYLWLKNPCNLTSKQEDLLATFLAESSTNTAKAYTCRIEFDQLWNVQQNAVEPLLKQWMDRCESINLNPLNKFVNTIKSHYEGVIKAMKSLFTNALSEGLNSVFQLAKFRARGFRNIDNFINMIYFTGNDFKFKFH